MLPIQMKDGVLYSDDAVEITAQIQQMKFLERILLNFKSLKGGSLQDI